MSKLNKPLRLIVLASLVVGLTLFLTGCFDLEQQVWITSDPDNSFMEATITTSSEEVYDLLKDSTAGEFEEDEIEFIVLKPDSPEEDKKFRIVIESPLEEDTLEIFPQNGSVAYELELLSEEGEGEMDEISRSLFEEHSFKFVLHLPKSIRDAWWGRYDTDDRRPVNPEYIQGNKFAVELDMEEAFSENFAYLTVVTKR